MCCVMYLLVMYFPELFETGECMCYPFGKSRRFGGKVNEVRLRAISENGAVDPGCRGTKW